ncbi:mitochondrial calcium uniporter regulator 1 [Tupaia chinensis]|uniref:mitochondrial calcium uniporter regulator 1 n=1 Tax=Tupaia chinensis TaxID=246437 RepID=UPI000FFB7A48|nr:mitochondrial calcium uniporter regulator 1 [Tupaia chinensis]
MDRGLLAGGRPRRTPGGGQLPLLLLAGHCGSPSGRGTPARRCFSARPDGLGVLRPCAPGARGGASRACPLLRPLRVPSRRLPADAPPGRPCAWRGPPGFHLCLGPAAALASSRRELSLSAGCLQLERKRRDFTSSVSRKLYLDTHALVCLLEENGNRCPSSLATRCLRKTIATMTLVYPTVQMTINYALFLFSQEITLQQIMSQIANVKKDMIILEKSEFSALRAENEKIKLELHQLKQQVMDEVVKVRTDTKLDFNLEKSRVKELYSLNERKLLEMRTEIMALHAQQDRALTQTDRKIETEVAGLKTMLESHKLDNIKYLAGSIFTCLTVALGFYRLWI